MIGGVIGGPVPAGVVGAIGSIAGDIGGPDVFSGWNTILSPYNTVPATNPSDLNFAGWQAATTLNPTIIGYRGGDPYGGGGPAAETPVETTVTTQVPNFNPRPTPVFAINPYQVAKDIELGSGWGMPISIPEMNRFTIYGSQAPAFDWSGFFNSFGGK